MSATAAIVLVARRLADVTNGVNALLATIPMDPSDGARPRPADVTVYNEVEENWVARGTIPREKVGNGALILVLRDPNNPQIGASLGAPETDDSVQPNVPVLIEFIAPVASPGSPTAGTASGTRDAIDTMRTVERCLHDWFASTTAANRTFAAASVIDGGPVYHTGPQRELQGNACSAAMLAPLRVTDRWALDIST